MEVDVFRVLIEFTYTDTLPELDSQDEDATTQARQLLAAADRYGTGRLKLLCEDKMCPDISVGNAAAALVLTEKHGCGNSIAPDISCVPHIPPKQRLAMATTQATPTPAGTSPAPATTTAYPTQISPPPTSHQPPPPDPLSPNPVLPAFPCSPDRLRLSTSPELLESSDEEDGEVVPVSWHLAELELGDAPGSADLGPPLPADQDLPPNPRAERPLRVQAAGAVKLRSVLVVPHGTSRDLTTGINGHVPGCRATYTDVLLRASSSATQRAGVRTPFPPRAAPAAARPRCDNSLPRCPVQEMEEEGWQPTCQALLRSDFWRTSLTGGLEPGFLEEGRLLTKDERQVPQLLGFRPSSCSVPGPGKVLVLSPFWTHFELVPGSPK
ncbi:hypothetical protein EJB05_09592, partial [Eragrostis curvula]